MAYVELTGDTVTRKQPDAEEGLIEAPDWVTCGCLSDDGGLTYRLPPGPALAERQAQAWEGIKAERDRRKYLGVKVGAHWFHSDDSSRIQQLGLVLLGQGLPAVQWKTLTFTPPPVFVPMTPALAVGIMVGTAQSDTAIFAAAEAHRIAMEASATPEAYDFSGDWPPSIEDEAHDAGIQFDAAQSA